MRMRILQDWYPFHAHAHMISWHVSAEMAWKCRMKKRRLAVVFVLFLLSCSHNALEEAVSGNQGCTRSPVPRSVPPSSSAVGNQTWSSRDLEFSKQLLDPYTFQ